MKTINEQINPAFFSQAKKLTQIKRFLHQVLPIECHKHVQVANIRQQILMLITDSPVWTTRLRQLSPQILQYIHENSQNFESCLNTSGHADSHSCESGTSLKSNNGSGKKPQNNHIIHHIQISTKYHPQYAESSARPTNKNSPPLKISNKTAVLLSQSADSINHPQLKTALMKLAQHGNSSTKQGRSR